MKICKSTVQHNPEILGKSDKSIKVALEKVKFLKELNIRSTIEVRRAANTHIKSPLHSELGSKFQSSVSTKKTVSHQSIYSTSSGIFANFDVQTL